MDDHHFGSKQKKSSKNTDPVPYDGYFFEF